MRGNTISNKSIYAGIIIFIILISAAMFLGLPSPGSQASVVTSLSTINYDSNSGYVKSGALYGSKVVAGMVLTDAPAELRLLTKGTETKWGDYTIKPQNNMVIKTWASSKAESSLQEYRLTYYKGWDAKVYQTKEMKGTTWKIYTPIHIEITADASTITTTLILSKDLSGTDLDGQQLISLGNGFNIQKVANANTGAQQLPTVDNIVVATAPEYKDITSKVSSDYKAKTYIFDRASYDSRVGYFSKTNENSGYYQLNDPLMALWTGYDTYKLIGGYCGYFDQKDGYCKIEGWNGLYKEVNQPVYNVRYDDSALKLIADPIQYGAQVNFEIPSENMQSLAVLRGAGIPQFTLSVTDSMTQGSQYYLTVTVDNIGDTDGFSIVPAPKGGKVLFSPASYVNQNIPAGGRKVFKFIMSVAGQETSLKTAQESIVLTVTPEHNADAKATKTFSETLYYKDTSETNPDTNPTLNPTPIIKPGDSDTMNLTDGKTTGDNLKWYETPQAVLLALLVIGLGIAVYIRKRTA